MKPVHVAGAAVHPFGKHPTLNAAELGYRAVRSLLDITGITPDAVDTGFAGSSYGGSLLAQRVLQRVGVSGQPVFTVENACASGASAVHLAWQAVASGAADAVIAFGAENLSAFGGGTLPLTTNDIEIEQGMVMPAAYAMRAQRYLHDFGATVDDLTAVSVKNRANGSLNERAHFQREITAQEVADSRPVADPLRLLHCCPNSDGAAAVLLCSQKVAEQLNTPSVRMRASVVRSGTFHTQYRDMTWPDITERTAKAAYAMADLDPADLDLVELHDAFSIAELLHAEALGLAERGKAHRAVRGGEFDRHGRVAVSPSGGLMSRGHPVGATGATQICEAYWQLTGQAGALQVPGASVALTHVTGGGIFGVDNGACSVHILTAD
ncbi:MULTISPECIES: thiolase family protein [unclassified Streptomyces]|uniref:thiolase family protein n=1 Tax=unclassified Streptomyces TaxID=2593676 RepID=UPI0004BD45BC|nr:MULTISPECIES: thiolase family protein [unclassified Streptomyces]KOV95531.1 propanoyl-CoA acyltransferase [Streptomyces sp. NRRL WC-3723]